MNYGRRHDQMILKFIQMKKHQRTARKGLKKGATNEG